MEPGYPELQHCRDEVAGKLADLVSAVPEPDAQSLPPERWAQLAWPVPCKPDEVRCEGRSCAAKVLEGATRLESMVLPTLKLKVAESRWPAASSKSAQPLVLPESLQPARAPSAPEEEEVCQRMPALERKRSVSQLAWARLLSEPERPP